jgi:antitoxin (DNA-binding transcriptional repressor) of toxin-antitoxin stability system
MPDADGVRRLTESGAARRFSEVLDAVAVRGECFLVLRCGRALARIVPFASSRGADVKALLRSLPADDAWSEDLRELRSFVGRD